mgnify:CR=1 FL=1
MRVQDQADVRTGWASFEMFVCARSDALMGMAGLVTRNWADAQDALVKPAELPHCARGNLWLSGRDLRHRNSSPVSFAVDASAQDLACEPQVGAALPVQLAFVADDEDAGL